MILMSIFSEIVGIAIVVILGRQFLYPQGFRVLWLSLSSAWQRFRDKEAPRSSRTSPPPLPSDDNQEKVSPPFGLTVGQRVRVEHSNGSTTVTGKVVETCDQFIAVQSEVDPAQDVRVILSHWMLEHSLLSVLPPSEEKLLKAGLSPDAVKQALGLDEQLMRHAEAQFINRAFYYPVPGKSPIVEHARRRQPASRTRLSSSSSAFSATATGTPTHSNDSNMQGDSNNSLEFLDLDVDLGPRATPTADKDGGESFLLF